MSDSKRVCREGIILVHCVVAWGIVLLTGCSDKRADLSVDPFLKDNILFRDTTVQAIASSSFKQFVSMDARLAPLAQNLIGISGDDTAYTLLQFSSSLFPNRDTIKVLSAKLKLRAISWSGTPGGTVEFTVYKITQAWSQITVRRDTLPTFDQTVPRGTYTGTVQADAESIVVPLDTAMVRDWLKPSTITSYGIILIPTISSNVVRGIHGFDFDSTKYQPTLEVIASNIAGTVFDTTKYTFGQDSFVGNVAPPSLGSQIMFAQAGVVYRSKLRFDVSFLKTGTFINSAELLLQRDPATTRLTKFTRDTVVNVHVLRSETDSTVFEALASEGRRKNGTPNTFTFDLRHAVQTWENGSNFGLLLRQGDASEYSTFDRYTFYNSTASDSLKPAIRIRYSVRKD